MLTAIEVIVRAYVRLKNRRALEEMLLHRQRLAVDLSTRSSGFDVSGPVHQVEEDIAVIRAGLAELGATVPVPSVNWSQVSRPI
jgi:transketolase C-terminal domain/subunit